ncbi:MAG TPA: L,D-transpeptidase family protein [Steroidobacteraceae bacterium]|nr:L,D-transpeptidase family protein [Steroidobacteraceae bacterium]
MCLFILAGSSASLPTGVRATKIVVDKSRHVMTLYANDTVLKTYQVALGRGDGMAKEREGDNRTPEGNYLIDSKSSDSQFYKSLHISYPSAENIARAKANGYSPGGAVLIHGLRNDLKWIGRLHVLKDWTRGCIAVTNEELDEIWRVVPIGTPIEIKP